MKFLFLSNKPKNTFGTVQMRCLQPIEYLRELGHEASFASLYQEIPSVPDVLVLHRLKSEELAERAISYYKASGCYIIYDTDDLIFKGSNLKKAFVDKNLKSIKRADLITVSTLFLKHQLRDIAKQVEVVNNGLSKEVADITKLIAKSRNYSNSKIVLGYGSGSSYHQQDFELIVPALIMILNEYDHVTLMIIGKIDIPEKLSSFKDRITYTGFLPYTDFIKLYSEIDINLVPLNQDDPFANGRSEIKLIEGGACGVPTVASPTATYVEAMDGVNIGVLSEDNEWYEKLKCLIENKALRRLLGTNAYKHVHANYGVDSRVKDWENLMLKYTLNKMKMQSGWKRAQCYLRYQLSFYKKRLIIFKRKAI